MGRTRAEALSYLLCAPALLTVAALALVPIGDALWTSLRHDLGLGDRHYVGFDNYSFLLHDPEARQALVFTLLFVGVSVPLELLLGLAVALLLQRSFRGRGAVRAATLVPWALPSVVTAWMWLYLFDGDRGLVNYLVFGDDLERYVTFLAHRPWAAAAVILADVWKTTPFAALVLLAGLETIPEELHEAARVDGAGPLTRFFRITLPLLRHAVLVVLLFRTMDAFRVFDLVYVMARARAGTSVLQYLGYQRLVVEQDYGVGCALSMVVFALIAVMSVFYVRLVGRRLVGAAG